MTEDVALETGVVHLVWPVVAVAAVLTALSPFIIGSEHVHCVFGQGEPDCVSHVALGGSMLIFTGNPATLTGGTGRFQGATGTATTKEVT